MSAVESPMNLVELIEALQSQQKAYAEATETVAATLQGQLRQHSEAGAAIARTLEQVSSLLTSVVGGLMPRAAAVSPVNSVPLGGSSGASQPAATPPDSAPAVVAMNASAKAAPAPKTSRGGGGGSKGGRGGRGATGTDSILGYIRENRNPTTADLAAHWKSEKRGGSVDNLLGQLVKAGTLKRQPNEQGRGSRYLMA